MNRILVIRGGAIGDFILTLPALKALRDAFPSARLEVLGYKHIAAIAENRFYADAVRSIEYASLSAFFAKGGGLEPELREYFGSFDLVISYLFDPDGIFVGNLRHTGARKIVCGPSRIGQGSHATWQLAAPLQQIGVDVTDYIPRLFPTDDDFALAREFLHDLARPLVALHIGSGSPKKNWPIVNWLDLGDSFLRSNRSVVVVSGEADESQLATVQNHWARRNVRYATNLALPKLAAVLADCLFVGHDSGISHLAAAAGGKCAVLFGPTNADVWAPRGPNVLIMRAPGDDLQSVSAAAAFNAIAGWERP
jgi:heptosyltransferase-2